MQTADHLSDHISTFSSYKIINLCLVPDKADPEAANFTQNICEFSQKLNADHPSQYILNNAPFAVEHSYYSYPHCTLMHMRINENKDDLAKLIDTLEPIIDQNYEIKINGFLALSGKAFKIDNNDSEFMRWQDADLGWIVVDKIQTDFHHLQNVIINATRQFKITYITGQADNYHPHFTCWAKLKNSTDENTDLTSLKQNTVNDSMVNNLNGLLKCKIAIANCGPIGQVTQYEIDVNKIIKILNN